MTIPCCVGYALCSVLLSVLFAQSCEAIKCFDCNSANNSACLDLHLQKMNAIIPVVDCGRSIPNVFSKEFFCRKITQTILHPTRSPEVRVTRGCGWVKHKRQCYTADNKDHLETVCQCFGDMCNAASPTSAAGSATVLVLLLASAKNYLFKDGFH